MDYHPLRYTNRELPEPEEGDEEGEAPQPVVDVVINNHRVNGNPRPLLSKFQSPFPG
jgi:hypothetical protein